MVNPTNTNELIRSNAPTNNVEYQPVSTHKNEGNHVVFATSEAIAAPVPVNNNSHIAWLDTFYDNEPDIQAVFDLDREAAVTYQRHFFQKQTTITVFFYLLFLSSFFLGSIGFFLGSISLFLFLGSIGLSICLLVPTWNSTVRSIGYFKNYKAAISSSCGMHIAITSTSVRYDQEKPMFTRETELRSIVSCTSTEKKFKFWLNLFGKENTFYLAEMKIANQIAPVGYVGIKDARMFARLVMSLKERANAVAIPPRGRAVLEQNKFASASAPTLKQLDGTITDAEEIPAPGPGHRTSFDEQSQFAGASAPTLKQLLDSTDADKIPSPGPGRGTMLGESQFAGSSTRGSTLKQRMRGILKKRRVPFGTLFEKN